MERTPVKTVVPLEVVRYDKTTGLVPVVVQDVTSGLVLMLAYTNREALKRTYGTGQAWFWSRSRQSYWHKGETSGNVLNVAEIRIDCDGDSVLYLVEPAGPACHTGETTCFYRQMVRVEVGSESVDPEEVDSEAPDGDTTTGLATTRELGIRVASFPSADPTDATREVDASVLSDLWQIISTRWNERPEGSYTTYLFEQGIDKIAKKVGEEATEVVIAAKNAVQSATGKSELASESADLLYHLLTMWKVTGLTPNDVLTVLRQR
jgi:phosphoribosyl-AMP cyclohydrolase / phosphoribosyl-ATP pyrophosphohydrolase